MRHCWLLGVGVVVSCGWLLLRVRCLCCCDCELVVFVVVVWFRLVLFVIVCLLLFGRRCCSLLVVDCSCALFVGSAGTLCGLLRCVVCGVLSLFAFVFDCCVSLCVVCSVLSARCCLLIVVCVAHRSFSVGCCFQS